MCNHIKGEPRRRIWKLLNEQKKVYLVDSYGTILLEALALQNYTEVEEDDDCLEYDTWLYDLDTIKLL